LLQIVQRALDEDLAGGDLTTLYTVSEGALGTAQAVAKESLVCCGGPVFEQVFHQVDPAVKVQTLVREGELVRAGTALWSASGSARSLLMAERTALNFVQRLCGIATLTQHFVQALPKGSKTRIADTRKTTPGLRVLERYAVRTGGGHNHRDNLGSAILIKDNHIAAAGGIEAALQRARAGAPHTSKIEVEVTNFDELGRALAGGAEIILLDNFDDAQVAQAVAVIQGRALIEVSGGIKLPRIAALAALGVDVISVGALTHSSPAADISLDLKLD
jgi:nicotinate-nucleotide pyrophosphorylase (carboxylating)